MTKKLRDEPRRPEPPRDAVGDSVSEPEVGIVFMLRDSVYCAGKPISQVAVYACCKDFATSHVEFWQQLLRRGRVPAHVEYDEVPRGRVVFHTNTERFSLLLDPCIQQRCEIVTTIMRDLHLPIDRCDVKGDAHYRCPDCQRMEVVDDDDE
jgi:hypothetical protein